MLSIIKVELFRLKKSVLFWVMFAITVALPLLAAIIVASLIGMIDSIAGAAGNEGVGASAWEIIRNEGLTISLLSSLPQIGSNMAVLSVITSSVVLSKEFSDGTTRNILLANKTRGELYFSYVITSIIISAAFLVGSFASTMIIVAPIFGFGGLSAGKVISGCLCSFAMGIFAILFMQTCMCMFLFATRKMWAAILFPLLICIFVPSTLATITTLIIATMVLKGQYVSEGSLRFVPFLGQSMYNAADIDGVLVGMNILYMALFTAMFVAIGYFTFKKADLK